MSRRQKRDRSALRLLRRWFHQLLKLILEVLGIVVGFKGAGGFLELVEYAFVVTLLVGGFVWVVMELVG